MNETNFDFQAGGIVVEHESLYIERAADEQIIELIKEWSDLICIFEPNQSGKTSLCHRTINTLKDRAACVYINLQQLGTYEVTEIKWYFALAYQLFSKLGLPVEKVVALHETDKKDPGLFLHKVIELLSSLNEQPPLAGKNIVIFFDDFDVIDKLDFSFDNFFAAINDPSDKISVVLSGVMPRRIIEKKSPYFRSMDKVFISLKDFDERQVQGLSRGLQKYQDIDGGKTAGEIFKWTSGHPYLSQKIGEELSKKISDEEINNENSDLQSEISTIVESSFFKEGIYSDVNISTCDKVFSMFFVEENDDDRMEIAMRIYRTLLNRKSSIPKADLLQTESFDSRPDIDEILDELRICGLVAISLSSDIGCRNEIYRTVFNERWSNSKRPVAT